MKNINKGYDCNAPIRDAGDDISNREHQDRLLEIRIKRLESEIEKTGTPPAKRP
jgi:hypothetical protein